MLPYMLPTVTADDAMSAERQHLHHSKPDLRLSDHNDDKHVAAEQQDQHDMPLTQ